MKRSVLAVLMTAGMAAASANAAVLWDQQPAYDNANLGAFADTSDGGGFANYVVSDITVPAGGWTIQSVTTYFSNLSFASTQTTAVLNIFSKSTGLPVATDDPRASPTGQGTTVAVSDVRTNGGVTVQPVMILTASGLNINLAPGEYWIGLTPQLAFSFFGADLHWPSAPTIGDASATRYYDNAGAAPWTNADNPGVDAAITINGVPAPGSLALLGIGGLAAVRRRRCR